MSQNFQLGIDCFIFWKSTIRIGWIPLTLCGLLGSACFSPDLGPTPFLCAKSGKKCPDDYTCKVIDNTKICVQTGGKKKDSGMPEVLTDAELMPSKEGPVFLDGVRTIDPLPEKDCADEMLEPQNNTASTAPVLTKSSARWEICYLGDVDQFLIALTKGDRLTVEIIFSHDEGDLELALMDPDGTELASSRSTDSNEKVSTIASVDGLFIIGVWGFGNEVDWKNTTKGRYDIEIDIKKK